jgi:pantetheine-phosphate adenylyltransferase
MKKFKFLVCGGTFDLLHKGHKNLLEKAFESANKVLIGITSDEYIKSFKNKVEIQDFDTRKEAVKDYLKLIKAKSQIVPINNAYEPNLEFSKDYDSILATPNTKKIIFEINKKRKQNGVAELKIISVPMVLAQDGLEISSTRIRNGEIDRNGRLYINPKWKNKTLVLPKNLRSELQAPWGEVLKEIPKGLNSTKIIAVGDATAQKFNKQNIGHFLSIVDFLIQRKKIFQDLSELGFNDQSIINVKNSHGTITFKLLSIIKNSFKDKKRKVILIEGEDDLSALAVVLIAPLGFSIFYGQPNKGLVHFIVTEENKEKAYQLIKRFDKV